ncbi:MAG: haloacid dehalogenase-like hydrolase [Alphaproteobacteria bacterium]|nr:haloacid dehalogenase-like hydrolase [Alphaproteobacteria bacterium]
MSQGEKVAFFDFDGTLAHGDSLGPFLIKACGVWVCLWAAARSFWSMIVRRMPEDQRRTFFKESFLFYLLRGRSLSSLAPAIARMESYPRWIESSVAALREHHRKGHRVVIASGSLDLYMKAMLGNLPYDDIICTSMEKEGDILSGRMESGNCVRERKAELVARYMEAKGGFDESWAYGNAPHDLPMMALMTHRVVV